jgi:hypothetical protein
MPTTTTMRIPKPYNLVCCAETKCLRGDRTLSYVVCFLNLLVIQSQLYYHLIPVFLTPYLCNASTWHPPNDWHHWTYSEHAITIIHSSLPPLPWVFVLYTDILPFLIVHMVYLPLATLRATFIPLQDKIYIPWPYKKLFMSYTTFYYLLWSIGIFDNWEGVLDVVDINIIDIWKCFLFDVLSARFLPFPIHPYQLL